MESDDLVGYLLKAHLFTEAILEELLKLAFNEKAEAILSIGLTYNQKLNLVSKLSLCNDWDLLPDYIVGSLRKLNKLRNRTAHQIGEAISDDEIIDLFNGLDDKLPYKNVLEDGQKVAIHRYIAFIFGCMLPKYESTD